MLFLSMPGCKKPLPVIVLPTEKEAEVNPWQKFFTEPFETIYFIMKDGAPFRYSNKNKKGIYMNIEVLQERLKKVKGKDYSIKDIAVFIHNYYTRCKFSLEDRKFYRKFKRYGFNGLFLLYCHRTNKTYDIEDNKK